MTPIYRGSRPDLAQAHLEPFCLVLSGSGSDVAVGLSRIKEQSGITLAQVTEDAEFRRYATSSHRDRHDGYPNVL
jgi:hypothetical protein